MLRANGVEFLSLGGATILKCLVVLQGVGGVQAQEQTVQFEVFDIRVVGVGSSRQTPVS